MKRREFGSESRISPSQVSDLRLSVSVHDAADNMNRRSRNFTYAVASEAIIQCIAHLHIVRHSDKKIDSFKIKHTKTVIWYFFSIPRLRGLLELGRYPQFNSVA